MDNYTHLDTADVTPDIDGAIVLERAKARGKAIRQKEGLASAPPEIEPLPVFPVGALPSSVADFILAAAENIQASADLIGPCALGALEIACGGVIPSGCRTGILSAHA